jgi:hypothetical protein
MTNSGSETATRVFRGRLLEDFCTHIGAEGEPLTRHGRRSRQQCFNYKMDQHTLQAFSPASALALQLHLLFQRTGRLDVFPGCVQQQFLQAVIVVLL